jgi:hypothetical protein
MAFHVTHRYGAMERNPSLESFLPLLAELEDRLEDTEYSDISVTHESEWCISVSRDGRITLEHLVDGGECHLDHVPRQEILVLLRKLAQGDIDGVKAEAWLPGYGN